MGSGLALGYGLGYGYGYAADYGYGYDYGYDDEPYYDQTAVYAYAGSGAVAACARRFRSYDIESQTYVLNNGRRRSCP